MSNQFYVWKDRNCNGIDPEWVQLTGREYFRFINDPANKGRCFVMLGNGGDSDAGVIYMEATPEAYRKWDIERQEWKRKQKRDQEYCECQRSLDELVDEDEELSLHEVVADERINVAEEADRRIDIENLREALETLSQEEMQIINALYFNNNESLSDRKLAKMLNLSKSALNRRKDKIFKKIRNFSGTKSQICS